MGGNQYSWSSWRIILPLVLSCVGWIVFHIQQYWTPNPSIPSRLFRNRTSITGYLLTFISSVIVQAQSYFFPIHFQAILSTTILQSGTNFLPFAIGTLGFAATSGILLSKFGAYRPLHATAFALSAIGFGLYTLLDDHSSRAAWAVFELIASAGCGLILSVLLPAIMAALPEADVASAAAAFAFMKTFGYIWGVTIASIMFDAVFDRNLHLISSPKLRSVLRDGSACSFASQVHLERDSFSGEEWRELVLVYTRSLRAIWWVGLGLSLIGFFAVGFERGLELRKTLDTDYGIDDEGKVNKSVVENAEEQDKASATVLPFES